MADTGVIPIQGGGPSGPIQAAPVAEPVNIAPGLAELGHAGGDYAQALRLQQNRDAVADAHMQVSQAATDFAQWQLDKRNTMPGDPEGYTPQVADMMNDYTQKVVALQNNPVAKDYTIRAMAALRTAQLDDAYRWQSGQKVRYRVGQIGTTTDSWSSYLATNPDDYSSVKATALAGIDQANLPPEIREPLKIKAAEQLRMAASLSLATSDPRLVQMYADDRFGLKPPNATTPGAAGSPVGTNAPAPGETGPPSAPAPADGSAQPGAPGAAAGGFDAAVTRVLGVEGGYVADDAGRGPTNMGINQAAHPGVDVANLTVDQARGIYKGEYWDALGLDKQPPPVQQFAFDTAVNQGPGFAKKMIAATGGDLQQMLAYRLQGYQQTAQDPAKAQYLAGWTARATKLANELGGQVPQTPTQLAQAQASTMVDVDPPIPMQSLPTINVSARGSIPYLDELTVPQLLQIKMHADELVKRDQADAQAQLRAQMHTAGDQAEHGVMPAMPDDALLARAYDPGKAAEVKTQFQTFQTQAAATSGAATMTPAELQAQWQALLPKSTDDPQWAQKQASADSFQRSQNAINAARDKDPMQAAGDQGIGKVNPLNSSKPDLFAAELKNRDAIALTLHNTYDVAGYSPFTAGEAAALAENFHTLAPADAVAYMNAMRANLSPKVYQAGVEAFAKGSPTIQAAGNFAAMSPTFKAPDGTQAGQVALMLLEGDRMLRPDKASKQEGARVYTLPPTQGTAGMDQYLGQQVGQDFVYDPDSYARAKQGVYAYYAADSARNGIYSEPQFDTKRLDHAIDMVIGQRSKFNAGYFGGGQSVLMPWGFKEDDFRRYLQQGYVNSMAAAGLTKSTLDDPSKLQIVRIDDYHYGLKSGGSTVMGRQGLPVLIDVNPVPAQP